MRRGPGEIITYLEMREAPSLSVTPPHRAGMLLRLGEPSAAFLRYLTARLGEPSDPADDEAVAGRMVDDDYDVYVLYLGGVPAALFELDRRTPGEIHLVRFGVLRDFTGRGLDRYVLAAAVEAAWQHGPDRVWAQAAESDDPRRILLLQWAGFVAYRTTREPQG